MGTPRASVAVKRRLSGRLTFDQICGAALKVDGRMVDHIWIRTTSCFALVEARLHYTAHPVCATTHDYQGLVLHVLRTPQVILCASTPQH